MIYIFLFIIDWHVKISSAISCFCLLKSFLVADEQFEISRLTIVKSYLSLHSFETLSRYVFDKLDMKTFLRFAQKVASIDFIKSFYRSLNSLQYIWRNVNHVHQWWSLRWLCISCRECHWHEINRQRNDWISRSTCWKYKENHVQSWLNECLRKHSQSLCDKSSCIDIIKIEVQRKMH